MTTPPMAIPPIHALPDDIQRATLVGRVWNPAGIAGPSVVLIERDEIWDITPAFPTMTDVLSASDPSAAVRRAPRTRLASTMDVVANSWEPARDPRRPFLLAPADLQPIRACGVTFVASLLERLVEERARGNAAQADALRAAIERDLGELGAIRPGSPEAERLKRLLVARGLWSQYLEVGFGPNAEVFTKAAPMSAVGTGACVGVLRASTWSNPEPEAVLAVSPGGAIVGVCLGNDVNLRDYEGRSALLLGQAKDNNASCAIGPFIRLLDEGFTLDDVRSLPISMRIEGDGGFRVVADSHLGFISRDVAELVRQAHGAHHQYPDGLLLFTGTMFAPTMDRDEAGAGFTHHVGDVVSIASPPLGTLVNRVDHCEALAPWSFGLAALMRNLAARGLLRE
ncbi:MAG: fumarylacetoacetate hydrolase family protein [Vicinamibacterales bacterium]